MAWETTIESQCFLDEDHLVLAIVSGPMEEVVRPFLANGQYCMGPLKVAVYTATWGHFKENEKGEVMLPGMDTASDRSRAKDYTDYTFDTLDEAWKFAETQFTFAQEFMQKRIEEEIGEEEWFRGEDGVLWVSYYYSWESEKPRGLYCPTTDKKHLWGNSEWNDGKEHSLKDLFAAMQLCKKLENSE